MFGMNIERIVCDNYIHLAVDKTVLRTGYTNNMYCCMIHHENG